MGKASKRAAERRNRQQAVMADGASKPLLDRANAVSMELHGVGIGVLTVELDRCKAERGDLERELEAEPRFNVIRRQHLATAIGRVRDEEERWHLSLRQVAERIQWSPDAAGVREVYDRDGQE